MDPSELWLLMKLSLKWTKNEEVLCHLKDDIKPPLHIKLMKSSKIKDLVNGLLNGLLRQRKLKGHVPEFQQDYLTAIFQ